MSLMFWDSIKSCSCCLLGFIIFNRILSDSLKVTEPPMAFLVLHKNSTIQKKKFNHACAGQATLARGGARKAAWDRWPGNWNVTRGTRYARVMHVLAQLLLHAKVTSGLVVQVISTKRTSQTSFFNSNRASSGYFTAGSAIKTSDRISPIRHLCADTTVFCQLVDCLVLYEGAIHVETDGFSLSPNFDGSGFQSVACVHWHVIRFDCSL